MSESDQEIEEAFAPQQKGRVARIAPKWFEPALFLGISAIGATLWFGWLWASALLLMIVAVLLVWAARTQKNNCEAQSILRQISRPDDP